MTNPRDEIHEIVNAVYLTEREVAARLGRAPRRVQTLRANGQLTYIDIRPVLIPETALNDFLERLEVAKRNHTTLERLHYGFMTPAMLARFVWQRRHDRLKEKAKEDRERADAAGIGNKATPK